MNRNTRTAGVPVLPEAKTALWIGLVAGSSILFTLALACAAPLAALGAIAGSRMSRRDALLLVTFAWLANQAVGFFLLDFPATRDSFAWGAAIGIAALAATFAAAHVTHNQMTRLAGLVSAFLVAFASFEAVLFASTAVLPSGPETFSLPIVAEILAINTVAFVGLLVLHRVATAIGLLAPASATPSSQLQG